MHKKAGRKKLPLRKKSVIVSVKIMYPTWLYFVDCAIKQGLTLSQFIRKRLHVDDPHTHTWEKKRKYKPRTCYKD